MISACFTSGFAGVSWEKRTKKWRAQFHHGGKQHHLGRFAEERGAAAAVRAAREAAAEGRLEEHLAERREARGKRKRAAGNAEKPPRGQDRNQLLGATRCHW